jgi:hypothetical protein
VDHHDGPELTGVEAFFGQIFGQYEAVQFLHHGYSVNDIRYKNAFELLTEEERERFFDLDEVEGEKPFTIASTPTGETKRGR